MHVLAAECVSERLLRSRKAITSAWTSASLSAHNAIAPLTGWASKTHAVSTVARLIQTIFEMTLSGFLRTILAPGWCTAHARAFKLIT